MNRDSPDLAREELIGGSPSEVVLDDVKAGARVTYHADWLPRVAAGELFTALLADAPWQREAPVVFGKAREVKRRTCAYGEPGLVYRYSGVDRVAVAWSPPLQPVVERLRSELGAAFNFALCNLYPDGDAAMGKHADAEREIVRDSPIAGLSLGATRDFALYDGANQRVAQVALHHGSLVIMWGATQRHYKHALPPRRPSREPRINLTFRVLGPQR